MTFSRQIKTLKLLRHFDIWLNVVRIFSRKKIDEKKLTKKYKRHST